MWIICILLQLYLVAVFVRIVLTWFPISSGGAVATVNDVLVTVTNPVLQPVRRLVPPVRIGNVYMELSSIIVIFGGLVIIQIIC